MSNKYTIQCLDEYGNVLWAIPIGSRSDGLSLVGHLNDLYGKIFEVGEVPTYNATRIGGYSLVED